MLCFFATLYTITKHLGAPPLLLHESSLSAEPTAAGAEEDGSGCSVDAPPAFACCCSPSLRPAACWVDSIGVYVLFGCYSGCCIRTLERPEISAALKCRENAAVGVSILVK